jgi:hypothetical protein
VPPLERHEALQRVMISSGFFRLFAEPVSAGALGNRQVLL